MNYSIKTGWIWLVLLFSFNMVYAGDKTMLADNKRSEQTRVIAVVKQTSLYIKKYGLKDALDHFKNADDIVIGDYNGMFFISPLHPELIGHSQLNYKDPFGNLVVQEEINKAKSGGGWLKGRVRKDPKTGKLVCRKIYIYPMPGDYYIGSWYHYPLSQSGKCLS